MMSTKDKLNAVLARGQWVSVGVLTERVGASRPAVISALWKMKELLEDRQSAENGNEKEYRFKKEGQ